MKTHDYDYIVDVCELLVLYCMRERDRARERENGEKDKSEVKIINGRKHGMPNNIMEKHVWSIRSIYSIYIRIPHNEMVYK